MVRTPRHRQCNSAIVDSACQSAYLLARFVHHNHLTAADEGAFNADDIAAPTLGGTGGDQDASSTVRELFKGLVKRRFDVLDPLHEGALSARRLRELLDYLGGGLR